ncbi:MAG: glycosyltransferase [Chitinophagaceae bacterium]|nr:MAG: glycosyltransferase [Chitinophagaceae bacterium]
MEGKKILIASVPAEGHVNPMTGLAKYLQSIGCDVRWYTGGSYAPKMEKLNIPLFPYKRALDVSAINPDEVFPEREKIKGQVKKLVHDMIHIFIKQGPNFIDDMRDIRKTFAFDVVVAECTFSAIPLIKKVFGVPVVGIGIIPLTEVSRDLPPMGLGMTPSSTIAGKLKQSVLRLFTNEVFFRKPNIESQRILKSYGVEMPRTNVFDLSVKGADVYLQSGTPGFEYTRSDMGKNIRFIGALLPYASGEKNTGWYSEKITRYKSIVLVTQGTVENDPKKLFIPALEAFRNTDTLVICTTGGSQTNELRARFPHDNIIIEDFISFNDVMPYVDVYITNGGYGGVMLGIQHALPMVAAGVHEGKNEICARIGYFNVGINLRTEFPSPVQIRTSVEKILADGKYKENVSALANEFKLYHPGQLAAGYIAALLAKQRGSERTLVQKDAAA